MSEGDWNDKHDLAVLRHVADKLEEEGARGRSLRLRGAVHRITSLTAQLEAANAKIREQAMEYLALDQQATEALDRAEKAEAERDKLAEFARERIRDAWDGCEGGDEIQDRAQTLGLIVEEPGGYDPEKHGRSCEAELGDQWFVFADWLKPAALKTGAPHE